MQGHFDICLKDARGLDDEDFLAAVRDGSIGALLASLKTDFVHHQKNTVHDSFPTMMLRNVFGRFSNAWYPHDRGAVPLCHITLQSKADEPVFYYHYGVYADYNNVEGSIGSGLSPSKNFITEDAEPPSIYSAPDGQEAVLCKNRFLWLPSQAVSSNIRSLGIFSAETTVGTGEDRGATARVRLKDAGGTPITIDKSNSQVLAIQYTFILVSL